MKKLFSSLMMILALIATSTTSHALTVYNDTVISIFGAGNPNGGWTTFTDNDTKIALRGKDRTYGTTPNNGAGVYQFPTGTAPASTRAIWNEEWSIDVGPNRNLNDLSYQLSFDIDPTTARNFIVVNPLTTFLDSSLGDSSTANGAGVETAQFGLFSIMQNSFNITFGPMLGNPNLAATYDFKIDIFDGNRLLNSGSISVEVGGGGTHVPDAGSTAALLGTGLIGLVALKRRK